MQIYSYESDEELPRKRSGFRTLLKFMLLFLILGSGVFLIGPSIAPDLFLPAKSPELDPNSPESQYRQTEALSVSRLWDDAAVAAERLAKTPGWEARALTRLGNIREQLTDTEGAAEAWSEAIRVDPNLVGTGQAPDDLRAKLARALLANGKPAESLAQLSAISRPNDAELHRLRSRAFLQQAKFAEAGDAWKSSGTAKPPEEWTEPAPYIGSSACAKCHESIAREHAESAHAKTLRHADQLADLPLPTGKLADPANPRITHLYAKEGDRVKAETNLGNRTLVSLVEFAIGSNRRGVTLLGRTAADEDRRVELRLSYYADKNGWGRTNSQPDAVNYPEAYLGHTLAVQPVRACLQCHATTYRGALERKGAESADRGVGCERCHGPGGNHVKAVEAKIEDLAIIGRRTMTPERSVALCASCHDYKEEFDPDPIRRITNAAKTFNVRFHARVLPRSRCFTESAGKLTCVTCHDPHKNASSSAADYDRKCLTCHAPEKGSPPPAGALFRAKTACSTGKSACATCHMPPDKVAVPHLTFSDHHIRIRGDHIKPAKPDAK